MTFKDNKLIAFVTLIRKRTIKKKKKTTAVKFQIPFSGFSLPKLIFRRLTSAWFGGVVPTKKRGYFELYLHQFKQNAQLSRFLFGLKWEQLTVCLNPYNSLYTKAVPYTTYAESIIELGKLSAEAFAMLDRNNSNKSTQRH